MRRLFFNLFVSVITFVIGIGAGALQSRLASSEVRTKKQAADTAVACTQREQKPEIPSISAGLLNNKAVSLPQPDYPPVARAARQSGTVTVQVIVDESGKVISARAVGGPPLLQASAVKASYGAVFSPTRLSGQPVKVTGVITYNFVLQ